MTPSPLYFFFFKYLFNLVILVFKNSYEPLFVPPTIYLYLMYLDDLHQIDKAYSIVSIGHSHLVRA